MELIKPMLTIWSDNSGPADLPASPPPRRRQTPNLSPAAGGDRLTLPTSTSAYSLRRGSATSMTSVGGSVLRRSSTRETTSLLMKELDNLGRQSSSSSSQQPPPSAKLSAAQPQPSSEQHKQHNNRSHSQHRHSVSPPPPSVGVTSVDTDLLRRTSESHNVAKAILQAVKTRVRTKRDDHQLVAKTSKNSTAVNGHATEEELHRLTVFTAASSSAAHATPNNGSAVIVAAADCSPVIGRASSPKPTRQQQPPSSPSTTSAAANKLRKNRFHLDLKSSHTSLLRRRAKTPPASRPSSSSRRPSKSFGSPELEPKGSGGSCFEATAEEDEEEHGLIAFNSALLQVTPSTSSTGGGDGGGVFRCGGGGASQRTRTKTASSSRERRSPPPPSSSFRRTMDDDSAEEDGGSSVRTGLRGGGSGEDGASYCEGGGDGGSISGDSCTLLPPPDDAMVPSTSTVIHLPRCCTTAPRPSSPGVDTFLQSRNRFCTSYRLKVPDLKNPVDICALPNRCLAIADYDNGFVILNRNGDLVKHCVVLDNKNACGVVSCVLADELTLLVLAYKEGAWSIVLFSSAFEFTHAVACPDDAAIETWALRKIAVGQHGIVYLMATGETKSVIWSYEFAGGGGGPVGGSATASSTDSSGGGGGGGGGVWKMLVTENSRRGQYNDFAVRFDAATRETHFLLCDWKKAQLSSVVVTETEELAGVQSIKMRRVKGQEWIVQGPKLACWDEESDIVLYDGSGKVFSFDGQRFKFKRIVADVGKGEVGALAVRDGWCYALCRYRLCVEAILYKEQLETTL